MACAGVFKHDGPYQAYVDVNNIPELKQSSVTSSDVSLGGNVTITVAIGLLQKAAELDGYSYAGQIAKHLKRVANVPVRNVSNSEILMSLKPNKIMMQST